MKRLVMVLAASTVMAAQTNASKKPPERARDVAAPKTAPAAPVEQGSPTKTVAYSEKDVVALKTKLRYTTLIVLPKNEQILDVTCGDKELWVVNGVQNMAYIKPAKAGAHTNINIITAGGNIYSFLLTEISEEPKADPDLKVFVEPKEESMLSAAASTPRFYSAQQLDDYRQQAELAREEAKRTKASAQATIDKGISSFVDSVRFPYRFEAGRRPFLVRAMYTDDRFTYIRARPEETPTLYEIKDGRPNLVNFTYKDGMYIVNKVLDTGYLAIGKQKLVFSKQE